jgi:Chlorophyll A-B binding protein
MVKLFLSLTAALLASASAFTTPSTRVVGSKTMLKAGEVWDPMGFYELSSGEAFDTFPGVFPDKQYLQASEIKQGRMAMLAWTGVWATTKVCTEPPIAPISEHLPILTFFAFCFSQILCRVDLVLDYTSPVSQKIRTGRPLLVLSQRNNQFGSVRS